MPTRLRRLFTARGGAQCPDPELGTLRFLDLLLAQPTPARRRRLVGHLLGRTPYAVAVVVVRTETSAGVYSARILGGRIRGVDRDRLIAALGSTTSPLLGTGRGPTWLDLGVDPFHPGAAFLRRFALTWGLVLPLPGGDLPPGARPFLLIACREAGERQGRLIHRIAAAGTLVNRLARYGEDLLSTGPGGQDPWPGRMPWDEAPAALAILTADEVAAANPAALDLLEDCLGPGARRWRMWLAGAVRRLLEAGRNRETVRVAAARDRALEVTVGRPLADGESRVVSLRDVTTEVGESDCRVDQLAILGHELQTPLTSLHNAVGLVHRGEAGPVTDRQLHFLGLALRNLDRFDRLIADVLDAARARAGRLPLRPRVQDLGLLLSGHLEMVAETARQKRVGLDFEGIPASYPANVDGDKIVQMVLNTAGNAVKYTSPGGHVRVWLRDGGRDLPLLASELADRFCLPLRCFTLAVQDSGPGMSQELVRDLFTPFRRGKAADWSSTPGSGLGLHITRGLVEAHGGRIDLTSTENVGTTVWIELPRDPESQRLLTAARALVVDLGPGPSCSKVACLDARRTIHRAGDEERQETLRNLWAFLARVTRQANQAADGLPLGVAPPAVPCDRLAGSPAALDRFAGPRRFGTEAEGGAPGRVLELAEGLWASVVPDGSRLAAAWEVELARPGAPAWLEGSRWQVIAAPEGPERDQSGSDPHPVKELALYRGG